MKLFQKVNMASETIHSAMRSGVVYSSTNAAVEAKRGDLVVPTGLENSDVYAGRKDFNIFKLKAPVSANATEWADRNLFIVDPVKVPTATNEDLSYRIGVRTLGLGGEVGEKVAIRKLYLNDQFYLGLDNLNTEGGEVPTIDQVTIGSYYAAKGENAFEHKAITPDGSADKNCYIARVDDKIKISQGVGSAGVVDAILMTVVRI